MFFLLITFGAVPRSRSAPFSLPFARQGRNLPCRAAKVPCRKMRELTWPDILSHWRNGDSRQTNPRDYEPECDFFPAFSRAAGKIGLRPHTEKYLACGWCTTI